MQVRVGVVKRSKKVKARVPQELSAKRPAIAAKLDITCDWQEDNTTEINYQRSGFANNPNKMIAAELTSRGIDAQGTDLPSIRNAFGQCLHRPHREPCCPLVNNSAMRVDVSVRTLMQIMTEVTTRR